MVQFTRAFSLLALLSVVLAASVKRGSVSTVEADVKVISNNVVALSNGIDAFGGNPNLNTAASLAGGVHTLGVSLTTGTTDTNAAAAFSDPDAIAVLNQVQAFITPTVNAMQKLGTQAPQFDNLHLKTVVCAALEDLNAKTEAFSGALQTKCVTQQAKATALKTQILNAGADVRGKFC
ncbi:hydrophobic surface binding protein A-domain-containing protein [Mycena sanguinolenta]|nr:hydrophobic surface binding protein A-domain-containing protein [Mycena sanguinolenta]